MKNLSAIMKNIGDFVHPDWDEYYWANYFTIDKNGLGTYWEEKPKRNKIEWYNHNGGMLNVILDESIPNTDWKKSIRKRNVKNILRISADTIMKVLAYIVRMYRFRY